MSIVRVATRGSRLSLVQTEIALKYISRALPGVVFEKIIVRTTGDEIDDKPISEIGVVGAFEREVDRALLDGRADIAVHSLKDLPTRLPQDIEIVFVPPREDPHDILIHRDGRATPLENLASGCVIGTSSLRRRMQILSVRDDVVVKPLRGNVDTRIAKLLRGEVDAIIVAESGVKRLGVSIEYYRLPLIPFTPAPGQGIIAVTALRNHWITRRLQNSSDPLSWRMMICERTFLREVGAGCRVPVGFVCQYREDGAATAIANIFTGEKGVWIRRSCMGCSPEEMGLEMARLVRSIAG